MLVLSLKEGDILVAIVVAMALRVVGPERIMYGSDEPLNLIRSKPYTHPEKGDRLATEYPYHWVDMSDYQAYKHLATGITHSHWQAFQAMKTTISALPRKEQEAVKKKFFHDNAKLFYGF